MKLKWIYGLFILLCIACNDDEVGFLNITDAEYTPNIMEIPTLENVNPIMEAIRLKNKAPWVTLKLQGVLGTAPIIYSIEKVTASEGGNQEIFKQELTIIGSGIMYYPLEHKAPAGKYVVSVRLTNPGYSEVLKDAYTFIVR